MRKFTNAECISAHTERANARAFRSAGQPLPVRSARYSQIASESQTVSSPCFSTGTRPLGPYCAISSLNVGVSSRICFSSKSSPRCFMSIHGRNDQDE